MLLNIVLEKELVKEALQQVSGYLDSEKIIIRHIRKQLDNGMEESAVENYLQQVAAYLEQETTGCGNANTQMNYRYVIGFINTLLRTPAWKSWMLSLQVNFIKI